MHGKFVKIDHTNVRLNEEEKEEEGEEELEEEEEQNVGHRREEWNVG